MNIQTGYFNFPEIKFCIQDAAEPPAIVICLFWLNLEPGKFIISNFIFALKEVK